MESREEIVKMLLDIESIENITPKQIIDKCFYKSYSIFRSKFLPCFDTKNKDGKLKK